MIELSNYLEKKLSSAKGMDNTAEYAEMGKVISVGDGIARVYGLQKVQAGEMVVFACGLRGMALNLEESNVGVVIFGDDRDVLEGDTVKRTGSIVDVPIGAELLGRVVDGIGQSIDGGKSLESCKRSRAEVKVSNIFVPPHPGVGDTRPPPPHQVSHTTLPSFSLVHPTLLFSFLLF